MNKCPIDQKHDVTLNNATIVPFYYCKQCKEDITNLKPKNVKTTITGVIKEINPMIVSEGKNRGQEFIRMKILVDNKMISVSVFESGINAQIRSLAIGSEASLSGSLINVVGEPFLIIG